MSTEIVAGSPRIALEVAGAGAPVLFLHGIGGHRSNWSRQLDTLSPGYRAAAWDMRGYGDSDDYRGPLTLDDLCADVARVLDHLGTESAHLVGLSMGGMIAEEFYRRAPERVRSLFLCNTNAGIGVDFTTEQKTEFVELRRRPLLEGAEPIDLIPGMRAVLFGDSPPPEAVAAIEASLAALHKASYIKAVEAIVHFDSSDVLPTIAVPTLLLGGTADRVTPLETMRAMHARIPDAELVVLDGVGHLSNLERPVDFDRALLDFLARAEPG